MRIIVKGKPKKVELAGLKAAAHWFADRLLGPRLAANITIHMIFDEETIKRRGIRGECIWRDRPRNPREFNILLDPSCGDRYMLMTLAHEMTHVKQYARNELYEPVIDGPMYWHGELVGDDVHYYEKPWEIEAHGRETLYHIWNEQPQRAAKRKR